MDLKDKTKRLRAKQIHQSGKLFYFLEEERVKEQKIKGILANLPLLGRQWICIPCMETVRNGKYVLSLSLTSRMMPLT